MKSQNLDELSRIVDLDKVEAAKNSIDRANGLPNECYINDDYFKIERERVFDSAGCNNYRSKIRTSLIPTKKHVRT